MFADDENNLIEELRTVLACWPLSAEEERLWHEAARCRGVDPDLFFPTRGEVVEPARALCRQCPVRAQCLATAIANGEKFGTWGGLTELERRPLRRMVLVGGARRGQ
jgi:WhiB family redox-sensing transcriptional regulator